MHEAQLPDSHEKGGDRPTWRAVCSRVVPAWWSVESARPSSSMVTRVVVTSAGTGSRAAGCSAGVKRSTWIRAGSTPRVDQGLLDEVHEGRRAADVEVGVVGLFDDLGDLARIDESLVDVDVELDGQAVGVALLEGVDLGPEDDRVVVPVGVEQVDPP